MVDRLFVFASALLSFILCHFINQSLTCTTHAYHSHYKMFHMGRINPKTGHLFDPDHAEHLRPRYFHEHHEGFHHYNNENNHHKDMRTFFHATMVLSHLAATEIERHLLFPTKTLKTAAHRKLHQMEKIHVIKWLNQHKIPLGFFLPVGEDEEHNHKLFINETQLESLKKEFEEEEANEKNEGMGGLECLSRMMRLKEPNDEENVISSLMLGSGDGSVNDKDFEEFENDLFAKFMMRF